MPLPHALSPHDREALRERSRTAGRRKRREWLVLFGCVGATLAIGWLFEMPYP